MAVEVVDELGLPDAPPERAPRRRLRIALAVACVLLLAGAAVKIDLGVRHRLDATRDKLATTRSSLHATESTLADTQAQLAETRDNLSKTLTDLQNTVDALNTTTANRDELNFLLNVAKDNLNKLKGDLDGANNKIGAQAGQITDLNKCLDGVERAINQISVGDQNGAVTSLRSVADVCRSAELGAGKSPGQPVYAFDFPDPFVLRVGGTYFGYATNAALGSIQVISSTNLTSWKTLGTALTKLPPWARANGTWAPSVLARPGGYVLYYSAFLGSSGEHCIGRATSSQPGGPYADTSTEPLVCQSNLSGAIDPSPYVGADGTPYLTWKSEGGAAPATIWAQALTPDGLALTGERANLIHADQAWEAGVVEGPSMVVSGGYTLFYSANRWSSARYGVGYATCAGPLGPCTKRRSSALFTSDATMAGPGGEEFFTDTAGRRWMAFHAYSPTLVGYPNSRELYLRRVTVTAKTVSVSPAG